MKTAKSKVASPNTEPKITSFKIPGSEAIVETYDDWTPRYRIRLNDLVTEWGTYEDTFCIGDKYWVSPYYHSEEAFVECNAVSALSYLVVTTKED